MTAMRCSGKLKHTLSCIVESLGPKNAEKECKLCVLKGVRYILRDKLEVPKCQSREKERQEAPQKKVTEQKYFGRVDQVQPGHLNIGEQEVSNRAQAESFPTFSPGVPQLPIL